MEFLAVVLLVGAGGAAYLMAVWFSTESRPIRLLCHLGGNRKHRAGHRRHPDHCLQPC
jgi:hypothetical protein